VSTPGSSSQTFERLEDAVAFLSRQFGCEPSGDWGYFGADGRLVGGVCRWDVNGRKEIRPFRRLPDDRWVIAALPEPRPLYNFLLLRKAEASVPIIVVEGEKAAEAVGRMLRAAGLPGVSTTSLGGASAPHKTDWKPLAGRTVILWPDNDTAGRKYAEAVGSILTGLACTVKLFDPARRWKLPSGFDAADAEKNPAALDCPDPASVVRLIVEQAEPWEPSGSDKAVSTPTIRLADVTAEDVQWLWPNRIPLGCITLLCGRPGVGKSFLTCDLAARISLGLFLPDDEAAPQGDVLLIAAEDDTARTLRPRCEAAGADLRRLHAVTVRTWTLADLDDLKRTLDGLPELRLIVLDPITHYLPDRTDLHRDNEMREALGGLATLARERGLAVLLVAHNRKAASEYADDSVLGSRALSALPRAVHHVLFDPLAEGRRLFLPGKCNLAAPPSGLAYRIGGHPPRVEWEASPVYLRADEVIRRHRALERTGPDPKARNAAEDWLRDLLRHGPLPTEQVKSEAASAGIAWRTIRRAAETLGVKARRTGGLAKGGKWEWTLLD
jgi:hypothetical protein